MSENKNQTKLQNSMEKMLLLWRRGIHLCWVCQTTPVVCVGEKCGKSGEDIAGNAGEQLLDVVWHPIRPILCSISSGVVSVWAQNQVENWSAFAPDFSELDENVEYEEKETEFDEEDEDRSEDEEQKTTVEDEVEVDVTSVDPIRAFCSSDEDEQDPDCLEFLPISPEIDEPEENVLLPPVDPTNQPSPAEPSAKKQKVQNIKLNGTPDGEEHPLLSGAKKPKKRNTSGRNKPGKPPKEVKNRSKVRQNKSSDDILSMGTTIAGF